jgi:hypothetical protein
MKTLEGPSWSTEGLDRAAGRYPLSVERHVMRMAELLVPGVTTVTPHARYYALHALIAVEAARMGLEEGQIQDLLRRAKRCPTRTPPAPSRTCCRPPSQP